MVRRKKVVSRLDQMLNELIGENPQPEDILGESGLLKKLTQRLVERALNGELNYHLKSEDESEGHRNSRNGHSKETVQSPQGAMELSIPRDRTGEFEPVLVPKHQRRIAGLDEQIIALYGRGLSTREISGQLREIYHAELRYGGTLDWAGYWRGDDTLWLLDFKTSDKAKTQKHVLRHSIQLAAYAMALESMTGVTVDRAGVLIGRPSGSGQKFLFDTHQMEIARSLWKTRVEQYHANQAAIAAA